MREKTAELCRAFISARDVIKGTFVWDDAYFHPLAAMSFVSRGITPDSGRMMECAGILKKNTAFSSALRGASGLLIIAEMSAQDDPGACLDEIIAAYDALKSRFPGSGYLPYAAVMLAGMTDVKDYDAVSADAEMIFDMINRRHRVLTSNEDVVPCLTLALSGMERERAADEVEACYEMLAPDFRNNSAQALAFALAPYAGTPEKKCVRAVELYTKLAGKEHEHRYGGGAELAALGPLSMTGDDVSDTADELIGIDTFLSSQKGYGVMGIDRKTRMMHAATLLTLAGCVGAEPPSKESVMNAVIAAETAVMATVAAADAG